MKHKRKKGKKIIDYDSINRIYSELIEDTFDVKEAHLDISGLVINDIFSYPKIHAILYDALSDMIKCNIDKINVTAEKIRLSHAINMLDSRSLEITPHVHNFLYLLFVMIAAIVPTMISSVNDIDNRFLYLVTYIIIIFMLFNSVLYVTKFYINTRNIEVFENSFKHLFYSTYLELLNQKFY